MVRAQARERQKNSEEAWAAQKEHARITLAAAQILQEAQMAQREDAARVDEEIRADTIGEAKRLGPATGVAMARRRQRERAKARKGKMPRLEGDGEPFKIISANVHGLMPRLADVIQWEAHLAMFQETEVPPHLVGPTRREVHDNREAPDGAG